MTENTTQEAAGATQEHEGAEEAARAQGPTGGEQETFSREYVQQLRDEAAAHRVKAKDRDTLADRLVVALVAGTGRLADPDDLPRTAELLAAPTPENVTAAVDELLARKPHLGSRRPTGDAGQGARPDETAVSLLGLLRGTG